MTAADLSRAQGCLLGQLCGDALGSLVEFRSPAQIRKQYPRGVRDLADGGTWDTLAGQPTDDSELALALARTLAAERKYNVASVRQAYKAWLASDPFDCGMATRRGIRGDPDPKTQANGALMRISPLGIFGANHELLTLEEWARLDAAITHPHAICGDCNALFVSAIAFAIRSGASASATYEQVVRHADQLGVQGELRNCIDRAAGTAPADYMTQQGWVLIAFGNALYQLSHACSVEEAIIDTVMRGGDTDTNAAICGALLGAVYGIEGLPERWVTTVLNCRPDRNDHRVRQARPKEHWPVDALGLAETLVWA